MFRRARNSPRANRYRKSSQIFSRGPDSRALLFLNDFGVLQHGNPATLRHLASYRDRFPGELGQHVVHWFVIADDEIGFSVRYDTDRTISFDAFGGAAGMLVPHRVVIDVAHHIYNFTGNFFGCRSIVTVLAVLLGKKEWRKGQRGNEPG